MHRKILEFVVCLEDTSVVRMSFYVCGDAVSWKNCSNSRRFQIILPSVDLFQCINVPAKYLRNCSCELYTRLNFNLILLQLSRPFNFNVYCTERKKNNKTEMFIHVIFSKYDKRKLSRLIFLRFFETWKSCFTATSRESISPASKILFLTKYFSPQRTLLVNFE